MSKFHDVVKNNNDEFYTPRYAIEPIVKYIPTEGVIWCPFDTEQSNYVKIFKKHGNKVIHTHINDGQDFFKINRECDYIISNPPYSMKTEVLEKLFTQSKPFAMLLGVVGLFESKRRYNLFANNNFEVMYFDKRIAYFKNYDDEKPSVNPPFSSVYICRDILPKQICFEKVNK